MPADTRLLEALLNRPHRVAGLRLRPFCARHHVLLELVQSPYLFGGPIGWPQLDLAASICASKDWNWEAPGFWRRLSMRLRGGWDLAKHHARMHVYLKDHWTPPQVWEKDAPAAKPGAKPAAKPFPPVFFAVAAVVRETGWDEERVWSMPLAMVEWYTAAFARMNGIEIDLVTEGERQAMEKVRKA